MAIIVSQQSTFRRYAAKMLSLEQPKSAGVPPQQLLHF